MKFRGNLRKKNEMEKGEIKLMWGRMEREVEIGGGCNEVRRKEEKKIIKNMIKIGVGKRKDNNEVVMNMKLGGNKRKLREEMLGGSWKNEREKIVYKWKFGKKKEGMVEEIINMWRNNEIESWGEDNDGIIIWKIERSGNRRLMIDIVMRRFRKLIWKKLGKKIKSKIWEELERKLRRRIRNMLNVEIGRIIKKKNI